MLYRICCLVFLVSVFLPASAFPWGSLYPGETHQYIIDTAYNRLKADPAYASNLFPTLSSIKSHEGVKWTTGSVVRGGSDYAPIGLFGVGPDGAGMSTYSEHYYNPRTGEGGGPNSAARYFSTLVRSNISGKANSEAGAKSAAYSAHFLADMFVPYHVVGTSRKNAEKIWVEQNTAHPGTINLGTSITGSSKLSYLTPFKGGNNNFNTELARFITLTDPPESDWFDPWYYNGNTDAMMIKTSSHVAWEAIANGTPVIDIHKRAGQGLPGYDPQWKNAVIPSFTQNVWDGQSQQVRKLAIQSATETRARLEAYFEDPTPALRNAIQSVYSTWRASFSGLRPTIKYQSDGKNSYKITGNIGNLAGAPASSVQVRLTAQGCSVSGPQEQTLGLIGAGSNKPTTPWKVQTTDKLCRLKLEVTGAYPIPDLQYAAEETTFFPQKREPEPVTPAKKPEAVRGSVDLSLNIFGIWDRGYRNESRNRVFAQRFWRDVGRKNLSGTVTPEGFSVRYDGVCYTGGGQPAPGTFVREEAQGRIQGDMLVELRYIMHRKDIWEEEKTELVMRDIPMEKATSRGLWRRMYGMAGANLETGKIDPDFPGHIVKFEHQITFTDDHVTCRLQKVDWGYSDYMNAGLRNVCHIRVQVVDPSQGEGDKKKNRK